MYQKLVNKYIGGENLQTWVDEYGKKQTEKHFVMFNEKGNLQKAGYMGPNTNFYDRYYKKQLKPINNIDAISMQHDKSYYYAPAITKGKKSNQIRNADWNMIKSGTIDSVKQLSKGNLIQSAQSLIGSIGILGKVAGENLGIVKQYGAPILDENKLKMQHGQNQNQIETAQGKKKRNRKIQKLLKHH